MYSTSAKYIYINLFMEADTDPETVLRIHQEVQPTHRNRDMWRDGSSGRTFQSKLLKLMWVKKIFQNNVLKTLFYV